MDAEKNIAQSDIITVIGGVNVDIGGRSYRPLSPRDSNPGVISSSLGGVGRNSAHDLSLLGLNVRFVTALGGDSHADEIRRSCSSLGIDLSLSLTSPSSPTSTYIYIEDSIGEMALSLTDTRLCDLITPEYLAPRMELINSSRVVFADANLSAPTLEFICKNCAVPVFADPVSVAKASRLKPILGRIHTLKPNLLEAQLLSGVTVTDENSLRIAAEKLLGSGLERVFISLGKDGVYAATHEGSLRLPAPPAEIISTNGAGDAFMAALGWAYMNDLSLEDTCRIASAAAAIALESASTINPALSPSAVVARAGSDRNLRQHRTI